MSWTEPLFLVVGLAVWFSLSGPKELIEVEEFGFSVEPLHIQTHERHQITTDRCTRLERKMGEEIAAKRAEIDGQISRFETDLAAQYQKERLNLHLTVQNSRNEATKRGAERRLSQIAQEITTQKTAYKATLNAEYAELREQKTAELRMEMFAHDHSCFTGDDCGLDTTTETTLEQESATFYKVTIVEDE